MKWELNLSLSLSPLSHISTIITQLMKDLLSSSSASSHPLNTHTQTYTHTHKHSQRRQRFICAGCKGVTSRFKWMVAGARTILAGVLCCLTTHIFSRLTGKLHAECCTVASLHNLSCPSSLPPQPKPQNVNCSALESMQTSCRTVYKMISLPGINIFSLHFPGWNHYLTFWMLLHLKGFSTAYWESHDLYWI